MVLLADDCLRLRLTSSDLLSLDTEPEVVCEAKADCAVEDWFDEAADGADEDLRPLEAVVFSSLAVSSVGRCCWLGTPLSWCIKDLASSQMPNLWPPFLTSLHRSQKRTTKFLASNFNSSILSSLPNHQIHWFSFIPKQGGEPWSPGDRECRSQDERRRDGDGGGAAGVGDRRGGGEYKREIFLKMRMLVGLAWMIFASTASSSCMCVSSCTTAKGCIESSDKQLT